MPLGYSGVYSALVDLQCEPGFDRFQDHVTVTIPHCATGDEVEESLCVLSAANGETELVEDADIEIESIDEDYVTFKTLHFCKYRVSKAKKRKQKRVQPYSRSVSLDPNPASQVSKPHGPLRSSSSPAALEGIIDTKFCVKLCMPRNTSSSSWKFAFIVTTDTITFARVSEVPC